MKLSAPIYRLKRKARLLSRQEAIPLHAALDRLAAAEGFANWSMLAARLAASSPAQQLAGRLRPGDMLLVGARPGHGKTLFGLELAVSAMEAGGRAAFFTLEYTMRDMLDRFRALGADPARFERLFQFDCSDAISAGHIIAALQDAPPGTLAVIDYLQILDQRRDKPELGTQIQVLKAFAQARGVIFVFISQIDRSYDPVSKPVPDLADVRLPNPLDLSLFTKTCFLNDRHIRFQEAA
jgi:hypothetical protein